ncbi:MAG: hypothetical protein H6835_19285 [Planctomycetes bacterium]|nr:hypothetical protein [Planctomycetota bacterium]
MHPARHLASTATAVARSLQRRGRGVFPLLRRDAALGYAVTVHRRAPSPAAARARWNAGEPVFLPGVLGDAPRRFAAAIRSSLRMFARLRGGAPFLDELDRRLGDDPDLRYAGSTVDQDDPREVERVFVDAAPEGGPPATDLWAKLAWIADDPVDRSLRVRFSCGMDQLEQWMTQTDHTAAWVDLFAARAFGECAAILTCGPLRALLDRLIPQPHRLSERILYNNAPNGGAMFHHDAEPGQLGVCYSQLEGRTAWLAIAKRRLARLLVQVGECKSPRAAMAALDANCEPALLQRLNRDERFTALLAARGALFVLEAGDSILLPSHGIDDTAWHSVLAIGDKPSLAHSYGLFPRLPDYLPEADPWRGAAGAATTQA